MRYQVAIALVVCGTLFALMPSISDYLHEYQVSQFLAVRTIQPGITRINQPFGVTFRAAAWVMGSSMIALAVLGSGWRRPSDTTIRDDLNSTLGHDMLIDSESRRRDGSRAAAGTPQP